MVALELVLVHALVLVMLALLLLLLPQVVLHLPYWQAILFFHWLLRNVFNRDPSIWK